MCTAGCGETKEHMNFITCTVPDFKPIYIYTKEDAFKVAYNRMYTVDIIYSALSRVITYLRERYGDLLNNITIFTSLFDNK